MSSPFSTIEAFNSAADGPTEGAIYTFANAPLINNIALLASVGIFCWFIISTYTAHAKPPAVDKSLDRLSSFIVIGLLSLLAAEYKPSARTEQAVQNTTQSKTQIAVAQSSMRAAPFGLLGMVSMGIPAFRRSKKRKERYSRSLSRNSWR
mgnify:CR=1 FL=1